MSNAVTKDLTEMEMLSSTLLSIFETRCILISINYPSYLLLNATKNIKNLFYITLFKI